MNQSAKQLELSRKEIITGLLGVSLLALFGILTNGVVILQRSVIPFALPISQSAVRVTQAAAKPFQPVFEWYAPQNRLSVLTERLAETEGKIVQLDQLQAENEQLRQLLENRHLQVRPRRLARPILSSISPLVWLGESSDVQPGWLVLYKDTVLGQVVSVDGQYARVALLVADSNISMLVQTSNGIKGIARARNGKVVMTNTAPDTIPTVGERVITVGQPGVAPGKFIGLITAIESDQVAATQTIVIDQLVSFYQTSLVEIEE